MLDLTEEIKEMMSSRNMSEETVISLIQDMLKSAYKRKFGTDENAVVTVDNEDGRYLVEIASKREVVDEENWYNSVTQIPLEQAIELAGDEVEIGDELEVILDPRNFEYSAVQSAKQRGQGVVKEYNTDKVYAEAKKMENKLVIGEIKRAKKEGDFLVNLNLEDTDALFPVRGQSPRETYEIKDKLKFYVEKVDRGTPEERRGKDGKVQKKQRGVRILLSRSSKEFVEALLENEVLEISSGEVEIVSIARHAGVRTKVAVATKRSDIDPVGAVVGKSGVRIQTIMAECSGEKIDVIRYDEDPLVFISNAFIPAQIQKVVMINPSTKHVVAIVDESQQGIAIGQGGINVKLVKSLCDYNIEVKTQEQFEEMAETQQIYQNIDSLFKSDKEDEQIKLDIPLTNEQIGIAEDETPISEIGLPEKLVKKLQDTDIWSIEEFFDYTEDELKEKGLTSEEIELVRDSVEITEEEEESFECPVCGTVLPSGTTVCPNCGAEFEFE